MIDTDVARQWQYEDVAERVNTVQGGEGSVAADFAAAGSALGTIWGRSHPRPRGDRFVLEDYDDARSDAGADSDVR